MPADAFSEHLFLIVSMSSDIYYNQLLLVIHVNIISIIDLIVNNLYNSFYSLQ